jgi:hypothetical protein
MLKALSPLLALLDRRAYAYGQQPLSREALAPQTAPSYARRTAYKVKRLNEALR